MTTTVAGKIARRIERWASFEQPDAAPGFMFLVNYNHEPAVPAPHKWPEFKKQRIDYAWNAYRDMCDRARWLDDDFIPYLNNLTGTEIFAEALGCKVARPEDNNPFALPCIFSAGEVERIKVPELSSSPLAYLFEIADELRRRGGPEALMKTVDIQSPMDIAALVWNKTDFLMAMLDAPEAVRELASKCAELLTAFMDEWFARYGTDYVAHYPDYFMRGGITLSEDEIGIVDAETFTRFFRDELIRLSEHFGGIGIHCCANSRHQWENFNAIPGLRVLNLCKPPTCPEPFISDAYAFFADGPVQMHFGWTPDVPVAELPAQFPANGRVVLTLNAKTQSEAEAICDTLNEVRNR